MLIFPNNPELFIGSLIEAYNSIDFDEQFILSITKRNKDKADEIQKEVEKIYQRIRFIIKVEILEDKNGWGIKDSDGEFLIYSGGDNSI